VVFAVHDHRMLSQGQIQDFSTTARHIGVVRGDAGGAGASPGQRRRTKFFLGIFVGMRQNGSEFGEVHRRR